MLATISAALCIPNGTEIAIIEPKNVRATYLYHALYNLHPEFLRVKDLERPPSPPSDTRATGGLGQGGGPTYTLTIALDQAKNRLIVDGTPEEIANIRRYAVMFDVLETRRVGLHIELDLAGSKTKIKRDLVIEHTGSASFSNPQLGFETRIAAMFQDDGYIRFRLNFRYDEWAWVGDFKLRPGQARTLLERSALVEEGSRIGWALLERPCSFAALPSFALRLSEVKIIGDD